MSRNQITRIVTLILLLIFVYLIRGSLFPMIGAAILYYLLNPAANLMTHRFRINRDASIFISFALLALVVFIALQFMIPPFMEEFGQLALNAPQYVSEFNSFLSSVQRWQAGIRIPGEVNNIISSVVQNILGFIVSFTQQAANGLLQMLSRIVYLVLLPIITYFMLKDDKNILKGSLELIPRDHKDFSLRVIKQVDEVLKNYITGQLILCSAVGLVCGVGCFLIGVKFSLILGVVAAVAQLIPNIGPLIASVPAIAIAALASPAQALYVIALYLMINTVMISVLGPKVLGDKLNLHPLTVVLAILVFGELMGVWGFFFAAPIAATLKILYIELRNP